MNEKYFVHHYVYHRILDFIRQVKQIVGEEIFACIAEFERVRPEDLLKRGE